MGSDNFQACYFKQMMKTFIELSHSKAPVRPQVARQQELLRGSAPCQRRLPQRSPRGCPSPGALPGEPAWGPPSHRAPRPAAATGNAAAALPGRAPGKARPFPARQRPPGGEGRGSPYPLPHGRHAPAGASATSPQVPQAPQPRPCCAPVPSDLRAATTRTDTSPPATTARHRLRAVSGS